MELANPGKKMIIQNLTAGQRASHREIPSLAFFTPCRVACGILI